MSNKETFHYSKIADKAIWGISKILRRNEQGRQEFSENLSKTLETNSLLIYFNHFSLLDPGLILRALDEEGLLDKVHIFASQRHLDNKFQGFVMRAASRCAGFEMLPTVQEKDKKKRKYKDRYKNINKVALRKAAEALKKPGNIVLIAPEGERSKTGALKEAVDGTAILLQLAKDMALAYPIAMKHVKVIPFLTKTHVNFGKSAFGYEEFAKETGSKDRSDITTAMMKQLSDMLPPENQGYYKR